MDKKLSIATLDPRMGGGVLSVTESAYEIAQENGYKPTVIYNALPWDECITVTNPFKIFGDISAIRMNTGGMDAIQIPRIFPEFEITNYTLNKHIWNATLSDYTHHFAVGGTCLSGIPYALNGLSFSCWVGTTIRDERSVQNTGLPFFWRLRDKFTRPVLNRLERLVFKRASIIGVQSEYTKRQIHKYYSIPFSKMRTIPVPVNPNKFSPSNTKTTGQEIIFVGRVDDPRKNIEFLLESFDIVNNKVSNAELKIIGGKPTPRIKKKASALDCSENITFRGSVDNIVDELQSARCFVIPSKQEGLCIAGLEAMSSGLPIVSTDCGGPEQYIDDGRTGFIVSSDSQRQFADRIVDLLTDEQLANKMSVASRNKVLGSFTKEAIADEVCHLIKTSSEKDAN